MITEGSGTILINTTLLLQSIYRAVAALLALTVHEVSHGAISYLLGDKTAKQEGRLSLNPLRHLDIVGAICLFLFRFGWAKPVPINPNYYKRFRLGTVWVSLAGPVSNFFLAWVGLFVWYMGQLWFSAPDWVFSFLQIFISMNLGLGVFNLFPVPPLDGSKILFALLPERFYRVVLQYERYGFLVLLLLLWSNLLNGPLNLLCNTLLQGMEWCVRAILL